jgi:hypothetical protein
MYYCHSTTSPYAVLDDAIFGRVDDIGDMFQHTVHEEFITNSLVCTKQVHHLTDYSYTYILVALKQETPKLVGETRWSSILTHSQYALLETNHAFVVGWMLLTPEHPPDVHLIEHIDSRVSNYNVVDCMIRKLENEMAAFRPSQTVRQIKPLCVLPRQIDPHNAGYWRRYLARRYDVRTDEDLRELIRCLRIASIVRWDAWFQNTKDGSSKMRWST